MTELTKSLAFSALALLKEELDQDFYCEGPQTTTIWGSTFELVVFPKQASKQSGDFNQAVIVAWRESNPATFNVLITDPDIEEDDDLDVDLHHPDSLESVKVFIKNYFASLR